MEGEYSKGQLKENWVEKDKGRRGGMVTEEDGFGEEEKKNKLFREEGSM